MACTPRSRSVHWGENELNEYSRGSSQSPYTDAASVASSESSTNATSTLTYINSQLVAHGFARSSGLSFDGLSKQDSERLAKCVLGMLSQRVEDMARTEELSTKLRTLSYEHERLSSMQRTTLEQLASSERETSSSKSRLAAAQKSLQASDNAHKATSTELQRARSSMHSTRQTFAAELKRREKEMERLLERWQKISDAQTKLGATAAGLKIKPSSMSTTFSLSGMSVNNLSGGGRNGNGSVGLLEDALEEAEMTRRELMQENTSLKNVVLSAANELVRMAHSARVRSGAADIGSDPPRLMLSDIFSISAPESAQEKFSALLDSFREAAWKLKSGEGDQVSTTPITMANPSTSAGQNTKKADGEEQHSKETQRLQSTIVDLRRQLEQAQVHKQSGVYADQAQAIIRRFVNEDDDKVSVKEREIIEKIRKDLDSARRKVDEAALALKDEKQALEGERQTFIREQHLWRSQMCIPQDPLPAPPPTGLAAYFDEPAEPLELPYSPPRAPLASHRGKRSKKSKMSPMKRASPKKTSSIVGAVSPRRAGPVAPGAARRSPAKTAATAVVRSTKKPVHGHGHSPKKKMKPNPALLGASPARQKVIPPMETEVVVHPLGLDEGMLRDDGVDGDGDGSAAIRRPSTATATTTSANATTFMIPSTSQQSLIISNSFVLPPPTPMTSLPPPQEDLLSTLKKDKVAATDAGKPRAPFPVAKPLAERMIHAYSPARPSPLSRILKLSQSPAGGGADFSAAAGAGIDELSYNVGGDGERTTMPPIEPELDGYGYGNGYENGEGEEFEKTVRRPMRALTLEEELGIADGAGSGAVGEFEDDEESEVESSVEDSPLRAKDLRRTTSGKMNANARGATLPLFGGGGTGAGGKGGLFDTRAKTKTRDGTKEKGKEDGGRAGTGAGAGTGGMNPGSRFGVGAGPRAQPGKGGPRRVPIGSADAAPIGPGWK